MPNDSTEWKSYKVAVVMPHKDQNRWQRIADWALQDMEYAQKQLPRDVRLEIEWHDENAEDIDSYIENVVADKEYVAIIGPYNSAKAGQTAAFCKKNQKTLILPIATSTEIQRIYAENINVWNMVQSDITQCELMVNQGILYGKENVSLLVSDGFYGQSFKDWIGYQAMEMGMKLGNIYVYKTEDELRAAMNAIRQQKYNYNHLLLFVPGSEEDVLIFDNQYTSMSGGDTYLDFPEIICSDLVRSEQLKDKLENRIYKGFSPSAAPETGFDVIYEAKYGETPINGEAHLFDSFFLLAYALTDYAWKSGESDLNESILRVVEGRETWCNSWLRDDLVLSFRALQQGQYIDLSGVTGDWTFDPRTHSCVLNTTYSFWLLNNGQFKTIEYISTDGGMRTISTEQAWQWGNSQMQEFNYNQKDFVYPELKGRWAIVVSTSDNWANYRHQSDALAMYQLLKRHGYDDDHIILVMEDNIAYHSRNIYPGVVKVRPDGENLYHDVKVDYKLSDINIKDLKEIMMGNRSERLSQVIDSKENDNIIIFWCGHGNKNALAWGSNNTIKGYEIRDILQPMYETKRFRKIFFALDACYSGSIGEQCRGIPGVIAFTAANADEPSHADIFDDDLKVWLSNGFTRAFQETIDEDVTITLRNLYYSLAGHTVGSHATVYNEENYGNLYTNSISEYLK